MATNRIKASVEGSAKRKSSPLTSAGKSEETLVENEIVIDELKGQNVTTSQNNVVEDNKKEIDTTSENIEIKTEPIIKSEPVVSEPNNTFGFVIEKKAEPDIKKQKMYNLKLGNIKKVKEIADATGMSESAIIDFLIENGSKVLTIK